MARATAPVDAASLAVARIAFGLVLAGGLVRYLLTGWVDEVFVQPSFFFKYPGFEWVSVPGPTGLYALVGVSLAGALGMALGLFYRVSAALFVGGFAWLNLMDLTNYLNHYYFVLIFGALLGLLPAHRVWSLDARRRPGQGLTVPAWMLWLLRFQIAVVYVHAGLAKVQPDWLLHAQPLSIWMAARTDTAIIGPFLGAPWVAYAMAWTGCLYDLTIVGWLLWKPSRPFAYAAVWVFHAFTHLFFDIGLFPIIMTAVTPLFFAPGWPRRFVRRGREAAQAAVASAARFAPPPRAVVAAALLWCAFQGLWPLRSHVYGGDVLWHEAGMRFAWKVMLREKQGSVTYRVQVPGRARPYEVSPNRYLDWRQHSEMSGQPDLIVQLAHHVEADFRQRGHGDVAVYADAWVSLNGRPPARLLDPTVDLTRLAPDQTGWILPRPDGPPLSARSAVVHPRSVQ